MIPMRGTTVATVFARKVKMLSSNLSESSSETLVAERLAVDVLRLGDTKSQICVPLCGSGTVVPSEKARLPLRDYLPVRSCRRIIVHHLL